MTLGARAGQALREGIVGAGVIVTIFVVLTDVVRFAYAQEIGAVLFIVALPWPLLVGALVGVTKLSGLAALLLGLSLNWMLLALVRHARASRGPTSFFPDRD